MNFLPLSHAIATDDDDSYHVSAAAGGPVPMPVAAAAAKEEFLAGGGRRPHTIMCSTVPLAALEAFPRDGTITLARALRGGSKISNGSSSLWEQGGILRAIPRIVGGGMVR